MILRSKKGKQKAGHNKARKSDLQWLYIGTQRSHIRRGNGIPSGSIYCFHQGPGKLCRAEVLRSSGYPDRNRVSEGCCDTDPHLKNGYQYGNVERSQQYRQNKANMYCVALGQCMEAMKNRLEGKETDEDINVDSGVIRLLILIKSIAYSYKSKSYPVLVINVALRKFYTSHQSSSSSCDEYFETMSNLRDVISHCGGVIGNHPFLVDKLFKAEDTTEPLNPTEEESATAKTATEEAYMATEFLSGLNNARYGALLNKLHNAFRMGRDE